MHLEPNIKATKNNLTNVTLVNSITSNAGPRNVVILEIIDKKNLTKSQLHTKLNNNNHRNNLNKELTQIIRNITPTIQTPVAQTITIDRKHIPNTIISVTTAASGSSATYSSLSSSSTKQTIMPKIQLRKTSISPIIATSTNSIVTLTNEPRATILASGLQTVATNATTVITKKPSTGIILLSQASLNELLQTVDFKNINNNNNNFHTDKNTGNLVVPMMT